MQPPIGLKIIRSNRKTISIEIKADASVFVRAPYYLKEEQIQEFIKEKEDWIQKHLKKLIEQQNEAIEIQKLTQEEAKQLANQACKVIPEKVKRYAKVMNVQYGKITIRNQKTRWGSCSGKGNLNFNCLLMLAPDDVIDYVVVHELCHLIEMNHSKAFWKQVEGVMPDYKEQKQWLKIHGNEIMGRMW